jgi:hypothetical protein
VTVSRSDCVIDYDHTFAFSVPVDQVWATMNQLECYPSWCSWLREFSVEGAGLEAGSELHGVVVPPLPYRMRLDVVLYESVPCRFISAFVHGDLEGTAHLNFESDGGETLVHAAWTIEMMQRPMRLAARIGSPILQWGHDRVVDATVEGFRRHLADECSR